MDATSIHRELASSNNNTFTMDRSPFSNRNVQTKKYIKFLVFVATAFALLGCPHNDGRGGAWLSVDAAKSSIRRGRLADVDQSAPSKNSERISLLENQSFEQHRQHQPSLNQIRRRRELGGKKGKKSGSGSSVAAANSYSASKGSVQSSSSFGSFSAASAASGGYNGKKGKKGGGSLGSASLGSASSMSGGYSYNGKKGKKGGGSLGSASSMSGGGTFSSASSMSGGYEGKKGKKGGSSSTSTSSTNGGYGGSTASGSINVGSLSTTGGKKNGSSGSASGSGSTYDINASTGTGASSSSSINVGSLTTSAGKKNGYTSSSTVTGSSTTSGSISDSGTTYDIWASTGTGSSSGSDTYVKPSIGESSSGSGSDESISVGTDTGSSTGTDSGSSSGSGSSENISAGTNTGSSSGSTSGSTGTGTTDGSDSVPKTIEGIVKGSVFNDIDGDGKKDYTEPGIANIEVIIKDSVGNTYTVTTDKNGDYSQTVPAGLAVINIDESTLPPGMEQTSGTDPTAVTVPEGGEATDLDGFQAKGAVEGIVWKDTDGDGQVDDDEVGIPNVSVVITDSNGAMYTVTTDNNGYYMQVVPAGSTTVDIVDSTVPSDYVRSYGVDGTVVDVPAGDTASDLDGFTVDTRYSSGNDSSTNVPPYGGSITIPGTTVTTTPGIVKGSVFNDIDGDGKNDYTETGIANVEVVITDSNGKTYTVTTDNNGDYSQTVPAGLAVIDIDKSTLPPGVVQTSGTDPTAVTVPEGGEATDLDGFQPKGAVEGIVWKDTDGNGQVDDDEVGIPNVSVVITDSLGAMYTVTTDNNGYYMQVVPAGSTTIDIVDSTVPSEYVRSYGADGTVVDVPAGDTASDLDGFTVDTSSSTGTDTDSITTPVTGGDTGTDTTDGSNGDSSTTTQAVKGSVFSDIDGDGKQGPTEPGVENVKVLIRDSDGTLYTVTTDSNGDYSQSVPAGLAVIDIDESTLPPGMEQTSGTDPTAVTVPEGGEATDLDGFQPKGAVEGIVWKDTDGNGQVDDDEVGIPNVSVVITDSLGAMYTVTTDNNGYYMQVVPVGSTTIDIVDSTVPSEYVRSYGADGTVVDVPAGDTASDLDGFKPSSTCDLKVNTLTYANVGDEYLETLSVQEGGNTESSSTTEFSYELVDGPDWLSLSPTGELSGVPGLMDVGDNTIEVEVTSTHCSSVVTITLTVIQPQMAEMEPTLPPSGRSVFELTDDALAHVDRAYDKFLEDRRRLLEEEARRKLSATKNTVVSYAGPVSLNREKGKNDMYLRHFDYFLEHGVDCKFHDTVIVLSQEVRDAYEAQLAIANQKCELMGHKIIVLTRQDRCYDMEAMRVILEEVDLSVYDEFVYLNCGVAGPKLPADHDPTVSWTTQYTRLLSDQVKMSGLSMNCLSHPHIQSMVFAVDQKGLQIIKNSGAVYDCGQTGSTEFSVELQFEIIKRYEIGMSRAIMEAGYSLAATMSTRGEMQIDPRDLVLDTMTWCYDVWHPQALHHLGGGVTPKWEELVFFKTSRLIPFEIYDELKYADPHLEPTGDFYYFETGPDTRDLSKGLDILLETSEDSED